MTARRNERQAISHEDRQRVFFLEMLKEMVERFWVRVLGIVLVENHYHLLVATPPGNLNGAMQWLGVSYSGGGWRSGVATGRRRHYVKCDR